MSKEKHQSATPATDWLKQHKVAFEPFSYEYVEHGGTASVAAAFGLDHHTVVKTLIMEDEHAKPLVILMHGDCEVPKILPVKWEQNISHLVSPSKLNAIAAIKLAVLRPLELENVCRYTCKRRFWNCRKFTSTGGAAVLL